MPLPRIRDGRKLSLMLPADVVARIKLEAEKQRTIPALVILSALDAYWGGGSAADNATVPHTNQTSRLPTAQERKALRRMYGYLESLIDCHALTIAEIGAATGLKSGDIRIGWRASGIVPKGHLQAVIRLLSRKGLPVMPPR